MGHLLSEFWDWTTHDAVTFYTGVLAVFTAVLSIVSAFQIYFLSRADVTARTAADAARISAEKQIDLTALQTDILEKQKEIARLQFFAEHRPRLRVRNVAIVSRKLDTNLFNRGELQVSFFVENIGGTSAEIVDSHVLIYADKKGLPMESPYEKVSPNKFISGSLIIGESRECKFTQDSPLVMQMDVHCAFTGSFPIFVMGWIHYSDKGTGGVVDGATYRIAFCRKWDGDKRRFIKIENDSDYESEG